MLAVRWAAVLALLATAGAVAPPRRPRTTLLQRQPDVNPDGAARPDPDSGRGANPMKQVPVVGKQFEVQPVSTPMKCVISLAVQYMLVYTLLSVCRSYAYYTNKKFGDVAACRAFDSAALTVNYAPMLAVLFLACRMRVAYQTQGKGNSPEWMQMCMYLCTYSLLLTTLTVCTIPVFTGDVIGVDKNTGDIKDDAKPFQHWLLAKVFTVVKFLLLASLYGGFIAIVYGLVTFTPPPGTWPAGKEPGVSTAVQCTTILCCQFFLVYFLLQCARTYSQFCGPSTQDDDTMSYAPASAPRESRFEEAMYTATLTMNYAPMLAILFLGARMRSLQMDPVWGRPQEWAHWYFYLCTYALAAQTAMAVAIVLLMKGKKKEKSDEQVAAESAAQEKAAESGESGEKAHPMCHEIQYEVENAKIGYLLIIARYAIMASIYVGITLVIYSTLTIEHRDGPENTPPISVTMQCVINLVTQYFFIYLLVSICQTTKEVTGYEWTTFTETIKAAMATVALAPMLAILFVAVRIRSLQMTNGRGAPQGWAQDGMYMSCWAVMLQFMLCLVTPVFTGKAAALDADGNLTHRPKSWLPAVTVEGLKWLLWFLLYGGAVTLVYAVVTMTPETANGRGSLPIVGDGRVPGSRVRVGDGIGEPVGPNDALDKVNAMMLLMMAAP